MSSPVSISKNLLRHIIQQEVRSVAPLPGATLSSRLRKLLESLEKAERKEIVSIVGKYDKCSPLFIACRNGNLEIVKYLIETCGADVEQKGNYEEEDEDTCEGVTPLWCAAVSGKLDIVKCLIEKYGANVNAISATGSTPVRSACYVNHENVVRYLVDHAGADINLPNFAGVTCLMNAVQSSALCEYLLAHGADVNAKDVNTYTALHYAIQDKRFDTTKLLIAHGADPFLKNRYGDDALQTSCLKGATSIFSYLLSEIPNTITRKRAAELHELMGSTFLDEHHDIQMALKYWRKGMDIRYNPKHRKLPKMPLGYTPLYATNVNHQGQGIEVEVSEFNTKEELNNIASDLELMRVNSLLIAERILGVYHKDMISRIMNRGAAYADSSQYLMCIHLWRYALQLRIRKDSMLSGDTCFTALELIRLYLDLDRNRDLDRNANNHPLKVADLMGTFQQLVEQFPACAQLVKVRPVFNRQRECFDRCLRCCAHLLYLLIKAPNKTQEESLQLRKMTEKLVSYRLSMCGTGDSLLHMAVSKAEVVKSHFLVNDYQEEVFPSEDVTKYLIECGADVNATNVSGLTALDVASLSENYNATIINVLKNGVQVNNDTKGDESSVATKTTTVQSESEFSDIKASSDILVNEVRSERQRAVARRRLKNEDRKEGDESSVVIKTTTIHSETSDIKASSDFLHNEVRSERQRGVARRLLKKEDRKEGDPPNVVTKTTSVQSELSDIKASSDILQVLQNEIRSKQQRIEERRRQRKEDRKESDQPSVVATTTTVQSDISDIKALRKNLVQRQINVEVRSAAPGARLTSLLRKDLEILEKAERKEIVSIVGKEDKCSPLFIACRKGNLKIVEYLIEICGADVEQKGNYVDEGEDTCEGVTPLWCAAVSGKLDIVKCLIEKYGANVNAISATGSSKISHKDVVHYLVNHAGARLNKEDTKEEVVRAIQKEDNSSKLFIACMRGNLKIVKDLIEKCGVDVKQRRNFEVEGEKTFEGVTPLWCACFAKQEEVVRYLVDHAKADINLPNIDGGTCLMASVQSASLCEFLLSRGAAVNVQDKNLRTALLFAIHLNCADVAKLLLSYGADPFLKGVYGDAFQFSCLKGDTGLFTYLLSKFKVSRERQADLHELMGAVFLEFHDDVSMALKYWRLAIDIRYDPQRMLPDITKKPLKYTPLYAVREVEVKKGWLRWFSLSPSHRTHTITEFLTKEELESITKDKEAMQVTSFLIAERLLGHGPQALIDRLLMRGAKHADASEYPLCIGYWHHAFQLSLKKESILSDDTCEIAVLLTHLFIEASKKVIMNHIDVIMNRKDPNDPVRVLDLMILLQLLVEQLGKCAHLVKDNVQPVLKEHQINFNDCLRCCSYLLFMLIIRKKSEQESIQLKQITKKLVGYKLRMCETGDSLLHFAVCMPEFYSYMPDHQYLRKQIEFNWRKTIFPSPEVTRYLIECGAEINALNDYSLRPIHLAAAVGNFDKNILHILMENGACLDQPSLYEDDDVVIYDIGISYLCFKTYEERARHGRTTKSKGHEVADFLRQMRRRKN